MAIEYLGLSEINGPLVAVEGIRGAFYDEIVEFVVDGTERKIGRIVEIYEDKAVIQVFEGSENMSLKNTHTKLTGHPMEIALSPDILGRTFNGIGEPIDGLGEKAADAIVEAAKDGPFLSKDDFRQRTKVSKTIIDLMDSLGLLGDLPESNQISIFDLV